MKRVRAPLAAALGLAILIASSGCTTRHLDFVRDDRVNINPIGDGGETTLPFKLSWTAHDFDGQFAIFFDRAPMRPGADLRSLVPSDDRACRAMADCPNADWLASRGIFVTGNQTLPVEALPDRRASSRQADRHEAVIVLLDRSGRRVGEAAFLTEFIVAREDR